ncbi:ferritin-2, chloroplastic [Cryptomeria japonica]|uniref:ferritin-2, chloroplastic n=1 Tax=Cryptomeria japonica TaxID=3369 RepID=UPI0025AC37B8|nr:ferritin-2, chloroplastic [Cryptomeria japonica]
MLLRVPAATSVAISSPKHQDAFKDKAAGNHSLGQLSYQRQKRDLFSIRAMNVESNSKPVTGVIFEPFAEVQNELVQVSVNYTKSFARQRFDGACEAALNEQINVEYNVSYIYHALFAYFDRDNVALPGFAKYFKDASDEERDHAVKLMQYQNIRGGKVKLQSILMPVMEFDHPEKGDALYAMELALSLEKLNNEKLLRLHSVAAQCNDAQMTDFIEGNFLAKQVEDIKKVSEYVAQLRRIGKGHGVWHFDKMLLNGADAGEGGVAAV